MKYFNIQKGKKLSEHKHGLWGSVYYLKKTLHVKIIVLSNICHRQKELEI